MRQHRNPFRRPLGFTLIELLVVIGIVGFLIALSGIVIGNMIGSAKEAATIATIQKVHGQVMERIRGLDIALETQVEMRKRIKTPGDRKALVKQMLPTRIADMPALAQIKFLKLPATSTAAQIQTARDAFVASSGAENVNSELLYFALTEGTVLGEATSAADQFRDSEVKDTNGNGYLEFIDGWGNPLRFYLYPTRLIRPDGWSVSADGMQLASLNQTLITTMLPLLSGRDISIDPDDPGNGYLQSKVQDYMNANPMATRIDALNAILPIYEATFHSPATYHAPLLVSAGPDGILGIREATDSDPLNSDSTQRTFGYLAEPLPSEMTGTSVDDDSALFDNITNYQGSGD